MWKSKKLRPGEEAAECLLTPLQGSGGGPGAPGRGRRLCPIAHPGFFAAWLQARHTAAPFKKKCMDYRDKWWEVEFEHT